MVRKKGEKVFMDGLPSGPEKRMMVFAEYDDFAFSPCTKSFWGMTLVYNKQRNASLIFIKLYCYATQLKAA